MDIAEQIRLRKEQAEQDGQSLETSGAGDIINKSLDDSQRNDDFKTVPLNMLFCGEQDRKDFDQEEIEQLAASIEAAGGLLQPIVVEPMTDSGYLISAGEKRYRALMLLHSKDPVRWHSADIKIHRGDREYAMLAENIQRSNLKPIEVATKLAKLQRRHNLNNKELAEKIHKTESWVSRYLALNNADAETQSKVAAGELSVAAAAKSAKKKSTKPVEQGSKIPRASVAVTHLEGFVEVLSLVCSREGLQPIDTQQLKSRKDLLTVLDARLDEILNALKAR